MAAVQNASLRDHVGERFVTQGIFHEPPRQRLVTPSSIVEELVLA